MTPKEKSEELFMMYVNKGMNQINPVINRVIRKEMAKQCALIAVEFAREFITGDLSERFDKTMYLLEVKEQIENYEN
jgi:hypothetical protein